MYKKVYRKVEDSFEGLLRIFSKYLGRGNNHGRGGGGGDDGDNGDLPPGDPYDSMPIPRHYRNDEEGDDEEEDGDDNGSNSKGRKRKATATEDYTKTTRKQPRTRKTTSSSSSRSNVKSKSNNLDRSHATTPPPCQCSLPAVKRTVNKDGPNKGKQFWACSKDFNAPDNCKFFEWVSSEDDNNNNVKYQSTPRKFDDENINTDEDGGEMRCKCGLIMKREIMKTGQDSGREFVKCPKIIQKCGLFLFLDGNGGSNNRNSASTSNRRSTNTTYSNNAYNTKSSKTKTQQKCFKCNKTGHWANSCPNQ